MPVDSRFVVSRSGIVFSLPLDRLPLQPAVLTKRMEAHPEPQAPSGRSCANWKNTEEQQGCLPATWQKPLLRCGFRQQNRRWRTYSFVIAAGTLFAYFHARTVVSPFLVGKDQGHTPLEPQRGEAVQCPHPRHRTGRGTNCSTVCPVSRTGAWFPSWRRSPSPTRRRSATRIVACLTSSFPRAG